LVACAPSADLVLGSKGQAKVTLWNGHTGEVVEQVGASMPGLSAMAITPDGTRIALADDKGRIYLRTRGRADPDRVIAAHQGPIHRLVFTPDGKHLASSGEDGVAAVWELNSGELLRRFAGPPAGVRGLGFDPAGQRLAVAERSGRIRVWDLRPNGPPREPVGHEGIWVTAEIDSRLGLIASGELMGNPDIWLWDVETGQARGVLRGHEAGITDLSFQPGRARLASSSADGTVRIWDLESKTIDRVLHVCKGKARAVAFDERGELLAAGGVGGEIRIWNPRTGQLVRRFAGQGTALRDLAFRPGGSALAASYDDGSLRLWSPDGSQRVPGKPEGGYAAWGVAFSPNGQILAAAGKGGRLLLVDLADDSVRSLVQLESSFGLPHRSIAFHPTRPWIGAAPGDAIPRRIWDTDSGNEVSKFANSIGPGLTFSFNADGRFALSEDASAVSLWDPETGAPFWRSSLLLGPPLKVLTHRGWLEPGSGEKVKSPLGTRLQQALQRTGTRGAVGADGDTICLLMLDGALEAWSLSRDERLLRNHEQFYVLVVPLAQACAVGHNTGLQSGEVSFISADSKPHKLADGIIGVAPDGDGVLVLTEKHLYSFDGRGQKRQSWPLANVVHSAIRLPEGVALGHFNGFVEIIDDRGALVRRLRDTPSVPISMLRPGPGNTLIVAAANGRVGVWHIPSGERLSTLKLNGSPTHMAADGSRWAITTAVGDHAVLDLSIFESERCELMRRVWQKAPVVWEAGRPQVRAAPTDHVCSVTATSPLAKSANP
jgi:WD40 repeat protein